MELNVAVEDFERAKKENRHCWNRIETAMDKINEDNARNIDITFQLKRLNHLFKSVSKFDDFQFHWEALKACYESGQLTKKVTADTQTDIDMLEVTTELTNNNLVEISEKLAQFMQQSQNGFSSSSPKDDYDVENHSPGRTNPICENVQDESDSRSESKVEIECIEPSEASLNPKDLPDVLKNNEYLKYLQKNSLDEFLGLYCIQCSAQFENQFELVDHLKNNETCKQLVRTIGLNYCFVCKKTYETVKKAKTHYTNYRNQGVNPHDLSRNLHRQWFDIIQFPTSREIESMDTSQNDHSFVQSAKCHGCQEKFPGHDECLEHITKSTKCQLEIKTLGKTFCFVCDRNYEMEKQAETHYRNSMYNGHQLHRMHHRQYFDLIRERKSPGRPPRNTDLALKNNYEVGYSLNASLLSFPAIESNPVKVELPNESSNFNSEGNFKCLICEKSFINEAARFNHLSDEAMTCHHQLNIQCKTICLICRKDLETESRLSSHLRLNKNEWHKKYYEMFYRKRPGKRSVMPNEYDLMLPKQIKRAPQLKL